MRKILGSILVASALVAGPVLAVTTSIAPAASAASAPDFYYHG